MSDDTYAYWMGYMLSTVKDVAQRTHDKSCVDSLKEFCERSQWATSTDDDALADIQRAIDGPTDDEIYNRVGVEGGIAYDTTADEPGSLGENDWRL